MKKIEFKKNNISNPNSKRQKYYLTNPKKLFKKKSNEQKFNNTAFYNYKNPYLNESYYKYELKENSKIDLHINRIDTLNKIFTKISSYKTKVNRSRPQSSNIRHLPKLVKNNILPSFSPTNYLSLESEKLSQEKYQLNKLVNNLQKELFLLKRENTEKEELLNNKEKEINKLITMNSIIAEEDNPTNFNNDNSYIDGNNINYIQNNSSYNLFLKIKKEIKNFNIEIKEEEEKINRLKHSAFYTKTYECFMEKQLLEEQINKITSLINNALIIKENNKNKINELNFFENKINIQKSIIKELKQKQKYLDEDRQILQKEINNIKCNLILKQDKVDKNKKEINSLIKKNNNLSKDEVIKSKFNISKNGTNPISLNSLYLKKISDLKKNVNFYKNQNKYNESMINKLKEQKKTTLETMKLSQNLKYSPSFLSLRQNDKKENKPIIIDNKNNIDNKNINANTNEEEKNENENDKKIKNSDDEQKINELRIKYKELKEEEKKVEEKYNQCKEKIRQINDYIQQQNMLNENNNINNEEEKDKEQNQIEFGIDENNPYYTDNEENQPEIENKFTSTQFNQFTYILFKNFEAKGIVPDESKNKIINPFMKIVEDNKLGLVDYPSEQFDFIVEEFTKIILDSINAENNYNHISTKIFVSALLFNSGCYAQKLIEYFNILFSYTRNYIVDEEKYLDKLKNKYQEQIKKLINCINNCLENEKKAKKNERFPIYFPLIKIKEIIEENNINLKDKYVEFLFYFLKKFNDNNAKLDELKYNLLNYIIEQNNNNFDENKEEDNKEKEENNKEKEEDNKLEEKKNDENKLDNNIENKTTQNININQENKITNNIANENTNTNINNSKENKNNVNDDKDNEKERDKDKDKYINLTENKEIYKDSNTKTDKKNENTNMEDSMTEITNEEYIKQINDAIKTIKNVLKKKNISFSEFIRDIKQNIEIDNKNIECFTIDDFNEKLKEIGILFSDLKLSCLCSKYSLPNELRIIEIKNIEEDINSK